MILVAITGNCWFSNERHKYGSRRRSRTPNQEIRIWRNTKFRYFHDVSNILKSCWVHEKEHEWLSHVPNHWTGFNIWQLHFNITRFLFHIFLHEGRGWNCRQCVRMWVWWHHTLEREALGHSQRLMHNDTFTLEREVSGHSQRLMHNDTAYSRERSLGTQSAFNA